MLKSYVHSTYDSYGYPIAINLREVLFIDWFKDVDYAKKSYAKVGFKGLSEPQKFRMSAAQCQKLIEAWSEAQSVDWLEAYTK